MHNRWEPSSEQNTSACGWGSIVRSPSEVKLESLYMNPTLPFLAQHTHTTVQQGKNPPPSRIRPYNAKYTVIPVTLISPFGKYFNGTVSTEPVATGRLHSVSKKQVALGATVLRYVFSIALQLRVQHTVSGHYKCPTEFLSRTVSGSLKNLRSAGYRTVTYKHEQQK